MREKVTENIVGMYDCQNMQASPPLTLALRQLKSLAGIFSQQSQRGDLPLTGLIPTSSRCSHHYF